MFSLLCRAKWCTSCTYSFWGFCKSTKIPASSYSNLLHKVLLSIDSGKHQLIDETWKWLANFTWNLVLNGSLLYFPDSGNSIKGVHMICYLCHFLYARTLLNRNYFKFTEWFFSSVRLENSINNAVFQVYYCITVVNGVGYLIWNFQSLYCREENFGFIWGSIFLIGIKLNLISYKWKVYNHPWVVDVLIFRI